MILFNGGLNWKILRACATLLIACAACSLSQVQPSPTRFVSTSRPLISLTATLTPGATQLPTHRSFLKPSLTYTPQPSSTRYSPVNSPPTHTRVVISSPSDIPAPAVTPTSVILHGKVLERANCRYGPGAPYLYKYGLLAETPMDVIGRNESGSWLLIQARGGDNPCWIKASLLEVQGDLLDVAITYIQLPISPYYGALGGVTALRQGDDVIVTWHPLSLRAGDEVDLMIEAPYVIEAWVCQDGEQTFTPVGAYTNLVTIRDEGNCSEASHARIMGAEKHGYTPWVEIPWP